MKIHNLAIACLAAACVIAGETPGSPADGEIAFARLKTLVGEWQSDAGGDNSRLTYELTAGGSALMERLTSSKMPSMLTVYYLDHGRLLLTHYCMVGNQPRMEATKISAPGDEIEFHFLDATNLSEGGGHMHNVRLRLDGDSHLASEWEFFEKDRSKFVATSHYTRIR